MKISITAERSCIVDESLIPRGWHGVRFRHGEIKKKMELSAVRSLHILR